MSKAQLEIVPVLQACLLEGGITTNQLFSSWVRNYHFFLVPLMTYNAQGLDAHLSFIQLHFNPVIFQYFPTSPSQNLIIFFFQIQIELKYSLLFFFLSFLLCSCVDIIFCSTCLFIFIILTWYLRWQNLCFHWILFQDEFSKLRRWWKGVNILNKAYIILPIHGT
jgi:hypothetical protein